MMRIWAVLSLALVLLPAAAMAQDAPPGGAGAPSDLRGFGVFGSAGYWKRFKTGAPTFDSGRWLRYSTEHPERSPGTVTLSVIPQKGITEDGRRILEIKIVDGTGDRTYVKLLFKGQPGDPSNLEALMIKGPGMPPFPIPVTAPAMAERMGVEVMDVKAAAKAKVEYLGVEDLKVPAGEFSTHRYRVTGLNPEDGREEVMLLWLSPKVPLYHIVKAINPEGTLLLEEAGEGARTDLPPFSPEDVVRLERSREAVQGMGSENTK